MPALLPVRPRPMPGEATLGYLMRVAEANGHASPRHLWHGLKSEGRLCQALDLTAREQGRLFGPLPGYWETAPYGEGHDYARDGKLQGYDKLCDFSVADFNHDRLRWCPLCLMDSCHVRGIWMLKLCCVCTEHKILLHEKCPRCGGLQSLHQPQLLYCSCGSRLTQGTIKASPPNLVEITLAMEKAIDGQSGLFGLPQLTIQQWLRLALYLGQFSEKGQPDKPGQAANLHQLDVALALMTNTAHLLDQWPDNFHLLLQAIQQANKDESSLRKVFGKLQNVLYRQLPDPAFQFLRDAFENYLRHHWQGLLCNRHRLFKPGTIKGHPQITLKQASDLSGSPQSLVRQLVEAELVPGFQVTSVNKSRRLRTINRAQVSRITQWAKATVTLQAAASHLQLPERRLRLLMAESLIKPLAQRTRYKAASWRIPRKQLDRFCFQPEHNADKVPTISVHAILKYWRLTDEGFIALVNALLAGELKPVSATQGHVPIGKAQIDRAQFQRWLGQVRDKGHQPLSVDRAAKQLGIKQQVAYQLVKAGLLASAIDQKGMFTINKMQLCQFREGYVSLAELAKQQHTSLRKLLDAIAVKPATGPGIDGNRQYFYRRAELGQAYPNGKAI